MKLKRIILVAVLMLPALVFLFLKQFGSNQFDLEIYHQNGIQNGCPANSGQHFVALGEIVDNDGSKVESEIMLGKISVFYSGIATDGEKNQIARVLQRFDEYPDMQLIGLCGNSDCIGNWMIQPDPIFIKCQLGLDGTIKLVLVDRQLRIRGYYETKLDDIDRLITESFVLQAYE